VDPARSEGGQRLYTDADVERLSLLKRVTDAGRAIGDVAELPMDEVRRLAREDEEARRAVARRGREVAPPVAEATDAVRSRAMEAVAALDAEVLEGVLRRAAATLGGVAFMEEVAAPLLQEVGDRWAAGTLRPAHEHVATAVVRRVLTWLGDAAERGGGPVFVVGTLPGERHELGALLAATTATLEGWAVTFLGPDLPPGDIAAAAEGVGARVVGISVARPPDHNGAVDDLRTLRQALGPDVPLFVGGMSSRDIVREVGEPGVRRVASLLELRDTLRGLDGAPRAP
jgi:methanogenic corrinoid protein MtbC1